MKKLWVLVLNVQLIGSVSFASEKTELQFTQCITWEKSATELTILPGPISRELHIKFPEAERDAAVSITDASGKKLLDKPIDPGNTQTSINIEKLEPGSYFVIFSSGNYRSSKLFVKQ